MVYKTRGVVFRFTRYGETSIIVNIFTELFGLQAYMINGVRSKSSKSKIALFQPLTLLDLVVYHRENANINRIKEVKCLYPYISLYRDIKKSTLAMFINEVVNKTVREESHAAKLCTFLISSMEALDTEDNGVENFHLIFLLRLSRYLGFGAQHVNEVIGGRITGEVEEQLLALLLKAPYGTIIPMTNTQRRELLELILKFYQDHLDTLTDMKSLSVLREIFS